MEISVPLSRRRRLHAHGAGVDRTTGRVYTVQPIALRCIDSAGVDGDRIQLNFNGRPIWSSGKFRLYPRPANERQIQQVDFARKLMDCLESQDRMNCTPSDVLVLGEGAQFELWERHWLMGHKRLGRSPVSPSQAGQGNITVVFVSSAARYALTYRVTLWQANANEHYRVWCDPSEDGKGR